jgi:hypothetical protein
MNTGFKASPGIADAGITPGLAYDRLHFDVPRTMFNYAGHGGSAWACALVLAPNSGDPTVLP